MKKRFISVLFIFTFVFGFISIPSFAAGPGGGSSSDYVVSFDDCSVYTMYSADDTTYKSFTYSFSSLDEAYIMLVLDFNDTMKENSFLDLIIDFSTTNYYDNIVIEYLELHEANSSVIGGNESFDYSGIVSDKSIIFSDVLLNHDVNSAFVKIKISGLTTTTCHFEVSNVVIEDSNDNLLGRISRIARNIWNSILELPERFVYHLKNGLQALFVPTEDDLLDIKDKFTQLLDDRFGAVYDSAQIIDDFSHSFISQSQSAMVDGEGADGFVTFPAVTVNLAGADFTFGDFEVDLVPDKFEGIVDMLKMITNITCTLFFVNMLKRKLEGLLS